MQGEAEDVIKLSKGQSPFLHERQLKATPKLAWRVVLFGAIIYCFLLMDIKEV